MDQARISSHYRPPHRPDHFGVDVVSDSGADEVQVHAPVAGTVEFVGGDYGTVSVRDAHGYLHQVLHLDRSLVQVNHQVAAGEAIGIMGGRGPDGPNQYADHVHYQVRDPEDDRIDPEADYPFFGDAGAADQGEGPGDPPGAEAGPGSYGGEAEEGAPAVPGAPEAPPGGSPPPGGQAPIPEDRQRPADDEGPPSAQPGAAQPPPPGVQPRGGEVLLTREARQLARLQAEATVVHAAGAGTGQVQQRAALLAAVDRLASRLELADLTAREAKELSLALLAGPPVGRQANKPPDIGPALRLAAYAGRATAYELAARTLAARARGLARILNGGGRDAAGS